MPPGVDLFARYNQVSDWRAVAAAGIRDVYVKLTNGAAAASPPGDSYVAGARGVGLAVGGYHYALAGDPVAQARAFAGELRRLAATDIAPALDFEDSSLPLSGSAGRSWIVAFLSELHRQLPELPRLALYSSGSVLAALGAGSITVPGVQLVIWEAEYGPNDGREHPVTRYAGHVDVHQYTSTGHVPGISGWVDMDDVLTDITEADMPLTDDDVNRIAHRVANWVFSAPPVVDANTDWQKWANDHPDDRHWVMTKVTRDTVQQLQATLAAQQQQITALSAAVDKLTAALPAAVTDALRGSVVQVHVDVAGQQAAPAPTPSTPSQTPTT